MIESGIVIDIVTTIIIIGIIYENIRMRKIIKELQLTGNKGRK